MMISICIDLIELNNRLSKVKNDLSLIENFTCRNKKILSEDDKKNLNILHRNINDIEDILINILEK